MSGFARKRTAIGLTLAFAGLLVFGSVVVWAAAPASNPERGNPHGLNDASDVAYPSETVSDWYSIDGDVLTVRIDEAAVSRAELYNYPMFGASGNRPLRDEEAVKNLLGLVNGKTFAAAQSLDSWEQARKDYVGGYSTAVSFFDARGVCYGKVQYDPGYPGEGVAIIARETIYCMDGDQAALIDALDDLVTSLRNE